MIIMKSNSFSLLFFGPKKASVNLIMSRIHSHCLQKFDDWLLPKYLYNVLLFSFLFLCFVVFLIVIVVVNVFALGFGTFDLVLHSHCY